MPPCGTSACGQRFNLTGRGWAGGCRGLQGKPGASGAASPALGRLDARPRRALRCLLLRGEARAHAPAAFSPSSRACQANFWPTAGPRAASAPSPALARPPSVCGMSGGMSSSRLSGQTPCVSSGSSLCRAPAGSAAGVHRQRGSLAARIASPTPPGIVPGSGAFSAAASARSSRADSRSCVADALQSAVVHVADCRDARAPRGRVYADGTGVSSGPRGRLLGGGPARPAQRRRAGQPAW